MINEPQLKGVSSLELIGGCSALDFTNTVHNHATGLKTDEIGSYQELVTWAERAGVVGAADARSLLEQAGRHPRKAAAVLEEARSIRALIYKVFASVAEGGSPRPTDVAALSRTWAEASLNCHLEPEGKGFRWRWRGAGKSLQHVLWPVIRSATELLTSPNLNRVRMCGSRDCTWLFLDRSKNRSRRWCEMESCGNREKSRRHYERTRVSDPTSTP